MTPVQMEVNRDGIRCGAAVKVVRLRAGSRRRLAQVNSVVRSETCRRFEPRLSERRQPVRCLHIMRPRRAEEDSSQAAGDRDNTSTIAARTDIDKQT